MLEKEIHLRVTMDEWDYLGHLKDKSDYIRDLINKDRLDRLDHKIIDSKIREHEAEIKRLKDLKKSKHVDQDKIHSFLEFYVKSYKERAQLSHESQRKRFVEKTLMPQLKKYGWRGTWEEIDELLLNWPDENV